MRACVRHIIQKNIENRFLKHSKEWGSRAGSSRWRTVLLLAVRLFNKPMYGLKRNIALMRTLITHTKFNEDTSLTIVDFKD